MPVRRLLRAREVGLAPEPLGQSLELSASEVLGVLESKLIPICQTMEVNERRGSLGWRELEHIKWKGR